MMSRNKQTDDNQPIQPPEDAREESAAAEAAHEAAAPEPTPEDAQDALMQELAEAQRLSEEYLGLAQRVQADFENFRRRNAQVRAEAYEDGARAFIKLMLPVLDNLERALAAESCDKALHEGVSMVYRQLMDALEKRGVSEINRPGEKFDPALENAVMQGGPDEGEPGTVCAVLQKGYKMGEAVLRYAMVKVVAE